VLAVAARHSQRARTYRSTSPAHMAFRNKPAGRRCCCRSTGQTDGRTDAQPSHRPYSAYYSGSVNNHAYIETYDQNQWTYSLYGTCSDEVMVQLATPASAPRFLQHVALVHGRVRRLIRGPLAGRLARTTRISSTDGIVA